MVTGSGSPAWRACKAVVVPAGMAHPIIAELTGLAVGGSQDRQQLPQKAA